ncbi:ZFP36L1 [Symbiodinium pilosum]|uniref:ZFP36L1 protein n=1 Tax=Symbiodinium pilosum TaxID=2952 RepID=A0A812VN69_SYMPI|nr:ZFP36L1 [Symbiodinium pilosum]
MSVPSVPATRRVFKKTQLCSFWVRGACKRGAACAFAHGESQLRETPDLSKTKICKMFQTGACELGESCTFAHCREELRSLRPKRASSNVLVEVKRLAAKVRSANSAAGSGGSLSSQELSEELSEVGYECYAVVEFESVDLVVRQLMSPEAELPEEGLLFKL